MRLQDGAHQQVETRMLMITRLLTRFLTRRLLAMRLKLTRYQRCLRLEFLQIVLVNQ